MKRFFFDWLQMKRTERDEDDDAADRLERELLEEQKFDAEHRKSFLSYLDYKREASMREVDRAKVYQGLNAEGYEPMWFRRVLAANFPRAYAANNETRPDGDRADPNGLFPIAMRDRMREQGRWTANRELEDVRLFMPYYRGEDPEKNLVEYGGRVEDDAATRVNGVLVPNAKYYIQKRDEYLARKGQKRSK